MPARSREADPSYNARHAYLPEMQRKQTWSGRWMHKATKETLAKKRKNRISRKLCTREESRDEKKQTLAKVDQTPSHALWYMMWVLYITFVNIACFVSCRAQAARLCAFNLVRRRKVRGTGQVRAPRQGDRGQVLQADRSRLREGSKLRCESSIPSESAAVSAVHGARPTLLGEHARQRKSRYRRDCLGRAVVLACRVEWLAVGRRAVRR